MNIFTPARLTFPSPCVWPVTRADCTRAVAAADVWDSQLSLEATAGKSEVTMRRNRSENSLTLSPTIPNSINGL